MRNNLEKNAKDPDAWDAAKFERSKKARPAKLGGKDVKHPELNAHGIKKTR